MTLGFIKSVRRFIGMPKIRTGFTIENREARYNYFVDDTLECGIELRGNEVKSIRAGMASIKEAWIAVENGNLTLKQMHISKWGTANQFDVDYTREKRLLAHKSEIKKFNSAVQKGGKTLIPLKVYFAENGRCKVLVGLCTGKKVHDKRNCEKERDMNKQIQRALKV